VKWNKHFRLEGAHAPFAASSPHWLNYDDDKVIDVYINLQAKTLGTKLHKWAKDTIDLGIKQPKSGKTIYAYVNDAIGFRMDTEVVLFYSENFFGTADAICFRDNMLRIHDLKTGKTPVRKEQLEVYTALFCLEYDIDPNSIDIELRIYQNSKIECWTPEVQDILAIMDKIVRTDKLIVKFNSEEV
jgi:hypothetical protein